MCRSQTNWLLLRVFRYKTLSNRPWWRAHMMSSGKINQDLWNQGNQESIPNPFLILVMFVALIDMLYQIIFQIYHFPSSSFHLYWKQLFEMFTQSVSQPITIVFFNLSNATQSNSCRSLNKQKCNKTLQGFFKGPWMLRLLFYIVINVTNVSKATNLLYFSLRVFSTCHCHCQCLFSLWSNISKVTSF